MATYLISGCSRGLGLAMTSHLLSIPPSSPTSPSTIFATARSESAALKEVIAKSSGQAVFIPLETTNEASIKNAVSEVEKVLAGKGLDVLINNAGIMPWTNGGIETM
jgi:NAD(P)-dependent dehydrogenase (short-subunit alcohol dehydrogenase family)